MEASALTTWPTVCWPAAPPISLTECSLHKLGKFDAQCAEMLLLHWWGFTLLHLRTSSNRSAVDHYSTRRSVLAEAWAVMQYLRCLCEVFVERCFLNVSWLNIALYTGLNYYCNPCLFLLSVRNTPYLVSTIIFIACSAPPLNTCWALR